MAADLPTSTPLGNPSIGGRILEAAQALLEAEGLSALTIRRLATKAGVAPMSIYHHLGSKDGVVDLLLRNAFAKLERAMRELATTPDPVDAYREAGLRYRVLALEAPVTFGLMFSGHSLKHDLGEETMAACLSSLDALVAICQRLVDAGLTESRNALDLARTTWAAVHGAVTLEIAGFTDGETSYQHLIDLVARGALSAAP